MAAEQHPSPTILRLLVGRQLRALRVRAGLSPAEAARRLKCSESKISRMELGRHALKELDVTKLLALYQAGEGTEPDQLMEYARLSNAPEWWHDLQDAMPDWARDYVSLESGAEVISCYAPCQLPPVLQTARYAAAVAPRGMRQDERVKLSALRAGRLARLRRDDGPRLRVILGEAAIRRPAGPPDLMREQRAYLIQACKEPRCAIYLLPLDAPVQAGDQATFTLLRFAPEGVPDVAFLDSPTGSQRTDRMEDVETYRALWERLIVTALPPDQTTPVLEAL